MQFPARLTTIQRLAETFNQKVSLDALTHAESQEILPRIGAEIEVPWRYVLADHAEWFNEPYKEFSENKKVAFSKRCDELDEQLQPIYQQATLAGIPKANERLAYHEFAHEPVNWYETLSTEIELLMKAGLIKEGYEHPMHVTISQVKPSTDVGIAAGIIQLYAGSTPTRMLSPQAKWGTRTWADKGKNGIKERTQEELQKGDYIGTEIRTLVAANTKQTYETLRCAQLIGASISAKQNNKHPALAQEWNYLREQFLTHVLKPRNLNKWWDDPTHNKTQWKSFAKLYNNPIKAEAKKYITNSLDNIEERITLQALD